MAGREHFYDSIFRKDPDTGSLSRSRMWPSGRQDSRGRHRRSDTPILYTGRKINVAVTAMQTDEEGEIDFWLDPGDYNITFSDTITPPRISELVVGFSSTPGAPNGMLRRQLPDYGRGLFDSGDIKMSGKAAIILVGFCAMAVRSRCVAQRRAL